MMGFLPIFPLILSQDGENMCIEDEVVYRRSH